MRLMSTLRMQPQDRVLPHLALLLDEAYMGRALDEVADAGGMTLQACRIERVKYRPQRSCVVGYKLVYQDPHNAQPRERRVAVCMYGAQAVQARAETALQAAAAHPLGCAPVALLASLNAVAWRFPYDRKLPSLPLLADAERVAAEQVVPLTQQRWGVAWRIADQQHTMVSYFPEHTCTLAIRACLVHAHDQPSRAWTLYGKTRYDDAGALTFAGMNALWDSEARRCGQVGYARPLGYDPAHRLLWQEGIAAPTLLQTLIERERVAVSDNCTDVMARVGAAIGAFHATPVVSARTLRADEVLEQLQRAQCALKRAFDGVADAELPLIAERLIGELERSSPPIDFGANATLHGDLHCNNILVGADRVSLIDFDRLSRGPALAELGSFLAEHIYRACVGRRALPVNAIAAVLTGYQRAVPWPVAADQLAWFTAAALVHERAYRCVTSLRAIRLQALPRLLETARGILRGAIALPIRAMRERGPQREKQR